MRRVDTQVRSYYQGQGLPPERATAILEQGKVTAGKRRRRRWMTLAALLLLGLGAVWLREAVITRGLEQRVAAEVAMNHQKGLAVEERASTYPALGAALDKLPFALLPPEAPALAKHSLVGGRYCSIQAQLAAQLKLQDQDGRTATLYVTQLSAALQKLPGLQRESSGVEIHMWSEGDLLYALATDRAKPVDTI